MKQFLLILMTCAVAMGLYAQQPCPGVPTVTDVEGNVYNTVKIGNQCWMKENLRTTHFVDGNPIFSGDLYSAISDTISYYYESPDSVIPLVERGLLYNWLAANNVCPTGWHLPTNAEWNTMEATQTTYSLTGTGWRGDHAGRLAGGTDWRYTTSTPDSTPGFSNYTAYNASGFTAIPAGYRYNSYMESKWAAYFWTATSGGGTLAWHRKLYYNKIGVYHSTKDTKFGLSVRCLRDPGPVINTSSLLGITTTSATCGGEVLDDDGYSVTARGVCWSTSHNPTVANAHTSNGTGVGSFTSSLTGLTPGTTYYVRAYATNSQGTKYGEEVVFATQNPPCPGVPTVTDHEGNVYNTIKIGNQCWTKENLRTTTSPSTGTYLIPAADVYSTYTGKQARWYNNDSATYAPMNYGLLYNWNAAVDTFNTAYGETSVNTNSSNALSVTFNGHRRGICPVGWHLPSDNEWQQLTNYMGSVPGYQCGGNSSSIAKALASTTEWSSNSDACNVGNQQGSNNATGFSAIPAGAGLAASFILLGQVAYFGSSSQYTTPYKAYCYILSSEQSSVESNLGALTDNGLSVRCLRNPVPVVNTGSVLGVTTTTATCGGEVVDDGGFNVTARGICWSTSHNPTIADAHTSNGTGLGSFTGSITGLTQGTTYYVRAYATNSKGTVYGIEKSYTSSLPCPGTPTVTDHEGNVYNTVKIGNQCWMKENLRTTTSPSTGTYLIPPAGTDHTWSGKQACWYDNDSATYAPMNYGLLYNWNAAVDTFNTAYGETSVIPYDYTAAVYVEFNGHRRGICPAGWHLPSDAEWNTLEATVSGSDWQTSYNETSEDYRGSHAGKLAGGDSWWYSDDIYPGAPSDYSNADRNVSGFSAVPAGGRENNNFEEEFEDAGTVAYFWSSTEYGYEAWLRFLYNRFEGVFRGYLGNGKFQSYSVRCLRDPVLSVTTDSVLGVTSTTATCSGEVWDDGGFNVTARGVCWSRSHNPTVTGSITGLTPGTTYYVRAYATNSEGTSYGEELSFTTELCALEDQCELTFVLTDSYGDGWNGNAIQVTDAESGTVLGIMANEDFNGVGNYSELTQTIPLSVCDGRTLNFEWIQGQWANETSYAVYDGNGEEIFSGSGGFIAPIRYTVNCASPCDAITLPFSENFDDFTSSTTTTTGVEPSCWELVRTDAPSMPNDKRPQVYYKSTFAHSGSYSLLMNYRCVYAMPEFSEETGIPLNRVQLDMYLRQANAAYQLEVGVWDDATNTFTRVALFNNTTTGVEHVTCDFSGYSGNGKRIAFRNVLGSGSYAYSYNYIDDITLTEMVDCSITLPYTENFDDFTTSTTTTTGVEPTCWELVRTDAPSMPDDKRPQVYYKSTFAHSGSYSLLMNYRCVYAMPEISEETDIPINRVKLDMYLRQANAAYQLEVGVWDDATNTFTPVALFNNTTTGVEHVTCNFSGYSGNGKRIAFRNVLGSGSYAYSYNYLDDITLTEMVDCSITLPYTETFENFTTSTTATTGEEPTCWELVRTDAPSMPNDKRPQVYYRSDFAHSGSYSLLMNYRCVYAMPEISEETDIPINRVKLDMYLRQANAAYQLEVGVWDDATNTFEPVALFNNTTTGVEHVTCDFSGYSGNGRRIAFRNVLGDGANYNYSYNYIDDITLTEIPYQECGISIPYSEDFDGYTESTTAATGAEPECWELVQAEVQGMTDANRPQIYYKSTYAHSGAYSLLLNYRGVYAMPELSWETQIPLNRVKLEMYLRQPKAAYQLQVGVWDGQQFEPVATFNNSGTGVEYVTCDFSNYNGNGRRIAFRNVLGGGATYNYSYNYIDDIVLTEIEECAVTLPYTETFESYTESTTASTGVEPDCWELVREDVAMTETSRPQLYYRSSFAHSGSYSLKMGNRCVYAMPALSQNIPLNQITLDMYLRQANAAYRLEVGVWDDEAQTFEAVQLFNNSTTNVEHVTCDFSNYTGNGRRIAFRNVLGGGANYAYSYNYLDDITLTVTANKIAEVTNANATDAGMMAADREMVDITVYPNPTRDYVNVQFTMYNVQCSGIEVIDVYGKIITTVDQSTVSVQTPTQINVSGLAAGMYFVRVTTDKGVVTKPFVKR